VSREDHVMWVLGSIGAVPGTFVWQTNTMEGRIAESQEVLYPGWARVDLDYSVFKALTLVPAAFKAAKNTDGAMLKDVVSPEIYARWLELKLKYIGKDDDIEKYRPMIAEEKLRDAIAKKYASKMPFVSVDSIVKKIAKKHRVEVRTVPTVVRDIEVSEFGNPRAFLKSARKIDFAEGECFGRNLARFERWIEEGRYVYDMGPINDWATGDLEAMRTRPVFHDDWEDCTQAAFDAAMNSPGEVPEEVRAGINLFKKQEEVLALAHKEAEQKWVEAAESALATNKSTFAVLPIAVVLSPTIYMDKLRARGYVVEAPR